MVLAKDFFDLQFSFAERIRDLSGMPLENALLEYTNLYVRFGLGRDFDPNHEGWQAYVAGLSGSGGGREWTYRFYLREPDAMTPPVVLATFGCFSVALPSGNHLRLHFRNVEADDYSPLAAARIEQRRAELSALFAHLRPTVREEMPVMGASWLYNRQAYCRLFPPRYTSTARPIQGGFRSMALWGQFLNRRGEVKKSTAAAFTSVLAGCSDPGIVGNCFPLYALGARAPAEEFYDFYKV